jgi:hypothetical protein
MDAKAIANGTIAAFELGQYTAPDGAVVAIAELRDDCVNGTRAYLPEELTALQAQTARQPHTTPGDTLCCGE